MRVSFFAAPALDLALSFHRVGYSLEVLLIASVTRCLLAVITAEDSGPILSQSAIQAPASGADVIGAIGTKQYVKAKRPMPLIPSSS
jgi:hypothetical protein